MKGCRKIICKRPAPPNLCDAGVTRVTGVTKVDRREGGEEGKGERGEEEGKLLRTGQTDGIEGSIKGPRETRPQVML